MAEYEINVMSDADLDLAVEWAARESWNPGVSDAAAFRCADPNGFFIGRLNGQPIAAISAVRYGTTFGFIGFYIVIPEARGRGYGLRIWQAAIDRLGERVIGLDGVPSQVENYRKSGFEIAHANARYGGTVDAANFHSTGEVRDANINDIAAIVAYDRQFFPAERESFIRAWVTYPQRMVKIIHRRGKIAGYGVVRRCRVGSKIGPLFAESQDDADLLFQALATAYPQEPVFLDVPEPNDKAAQLAQKYGLAPVFETARMYRGPAPQLPLSRIYGITTFELG